MREVRLLANGMVSNGFSYRGFQAGLARAPHMIGCDAGTSDYGPGPLGSGKDIKPAVSVERDLRIMLLGAREIGVPLIIGSCGVAGAAPHVAGYRKIIEEIARTEGLHFRLAVVHCDIDKEKLKLEVAAGRVHSHGAVAPLTSETIDASSYIVGMAGAKPFISALDAGADVILGGRCTDPAIYASVALRAGIPAGPAWHAARTIDKGNLATTDPGEGSPVLATVSEEGFTIEPTKEGAACTVKTVAALTMYENPDPWTIRQPSGAISAEFSRFEQIDPRTVRVTGSQFTPAVKQTIKLEGAKQVGFRSAFLVGIRDPRVIRELDSYLAKYQALIARIARSIGVEPGTWRVKFRVYGRDAVMGALEPLRDTPSHEIGLLVDVVAATAEMSEALLTRASAAGAKLDPSGGIAAGANFAAPFSPNFMKLGPVYEWSVWHLLELADEAQPFRVELFDL
jgi:hypothetical protein